MEGWGKGALPVELKAKALRGARKLNVNWQLTSLIKALG